jgi:hypothetical protein
MPACLQALMVVQCVGFTRWLILTSMGEPNLQAAITARKHFCTRLCGAGLCGAGLCGAGLCGAGLCGAGLCGAGLSPDPACIKAQRMVSQQQQPGSVCNLRSSITLGCASKGCAFGRLSQLPTVCCLEVCLFMGVFVPSACV